MERDERLDELMNLAQLGDGSHLRKPRHHDSRESFSPVGTRADPRGWRRSARASVRHEPNEHAPRRGAPGRWLRGFATVPMGPRLRQTHEPQRVHAGAVRAGPLGVHAGVPGPGGRNRNRQQGPGQLDGRRDVDAPGAIPGVHGGAGMEADDRRSVIECPFCGDPGVHPFCIG